MTLTDFRHRLTDPAYRQSLLHRVTTDTLTVDEECHLLTVAFGEPHRRWANTERTQPWPTVWLLLRHEHRTTPFGPS
jgi:hypothetical protein